MVNKLKRKDLTAVRLKLLEYQHHKCAICGCVLTLETSCVDHQHMHSYESHGCKGAGLVRGVLCRNCNALEGKIWNNTLRYGVVKEGVVTDRVQWLHNLINYYQNNYQQIEQLVHPSEIKSEKLSKSCYNRIYKAFKLDASNYNKKGKLKKFPKYTGILTTSLNTLREKYDINI